MHEDWGRKDVKLPRLERRSPWLELGTKGEERGGTAEGVRHLVPGKDTESLESQGWLEGKEVVRLAFGRIHWLT